MEERNFEYDKDAAEAFSDPFFFALCIHIENIQKEENPPEIKKEYIEGLETLLGQEDISSSPVILEELKKCAPLIHTSGVENEMCVMLGHVVQNVEKASRALVQGRVFRECIALYRKKPQTVKKIVFLLTVLNNTLKELPLEIKCAGCDPKQLEEIGLADKHLDATAQERLKVLRKAFEIE